MKAPVKAAREQWMQEPRKRPAANHLGPESSAPESAGEADFARFPCLSVCLALQCPRGLGDYCAFAMEVHQSATESVESVAS
jgi:hypothetical protein